MVTLYPIYPEQETEELGDDILARFNPEAEAIEAIEIVFWSRRLAAGESVFVPLVALLQAGRAIGGGVKPQRFGGLV